MAIEGYLKRGNPANLLLRGKGSCTLNVALCSLIKEIATKSGLKTSTPSGFAVARDPQTLNPVLIPVDQIGAQGVALTWYNGGRRATAHLGQALAAMNLSIAPANHDVIHIPVELVNDPATGAPGLMVRADRTREHIVKHRGPHKASGAGHSPAKMQAEVSPLQAGGSQEPEPQ